MNRHGRPPPVLITLVLRRHPSSRSNIWQVDGPFCWSRIICSGAYGYSSIPFRSRWACSPAASSGQPPERGDVAVFHYPGDQGQGVQPDRLPSSASSAACRTSHPGDNGVLHQRHRGHSFYAHPVKYSKGGSFYPKGPATQRTLPNGRTCTVLRYSDAGPADNTPGSWSRTITSSWATIATVARQPGTRLMLRDFSGSARDRDQLSWYVPAENLVRARHHLWVLA